MKKSYNAPKSERALLDPLMSIFGTNEASPAAPSMNVVGEGQQGQKYED